jgi:PPK2 family polyphosphate:nucleotide phosphotransferase
MINISDYQFKKAQNLSDFSPSDTGKYKDKKEAEEKLKVNIKLLSGLQEKLYAYDKYGVLIILQAMDAAGKDGIIKHVMTSVNPQGCQVKSFKSPSSEELDHDYMWRCNKHLPERGNIAIFNRSYYEEVLVCRVHPEFLVSQKLPVDYLNSGKFWDERFSHFNNFEKYLNDNGIIVLKFFLNISKKEQKKRFLNRIELKEKNWKFSAADIKERKHWDKYMDVYEQMLQNTSTDVAPWHVIPSNHKWYSRLLVSEIIVQKLDSLNLKYPVVSDEMLNLIAEAKQTLLNDFE